MRKLSTCSFFSTCVVSSVSCLLLVSCSTDQLWLPQVRHQDAFENPKIENKRIAVQPVEVAYHQVAKTEHIAISDFNMDNQGSQIIVKPGTTIQASTQYSYHCQTCVSDLNNQIIVGLAGRSAQACIYDGGTEGQGSTNFSLKVPAKPGKYEVRFRAIQAASCSDALKIGWNSETTPSTDATIGKIVVSRKEVI